MHLSQSNERREMNDLQPVNIISLGVSINIEWPASSWAKANSNIKLIL